MGMVTATRLDEVVVVTTYTWELSWFLHYSKYTFFREHWNVVDEARYRATVSMMRMFGVSRF
jgi:galactose-1-phosphate uridylyltransferase